MDTNLVFDLLLFVVAFLYASVGHGGASGYLALMALFAFSPDIMKPTALLLNLFVSLTSFIQFYRGRHFNMKLFLPFALASVPMAYIGGLITLDGGVYKKILGVLLLIPVARFLFFATIKDHELRKANPALSIFIGAAIGFLSGLIGIGGGIILSPVLILLKWANMKQAAAVSALFIFVNSLSGLAGQMSKGISFTTDMYLYVAMAFAGGICGAYYGAHRFRHTILQYLLAIVLAVAAYKLLFTRA